MIVASGTSYAMITIFMYRIYYVDAEVMRFILRGTNAHALW